MATPFDAFATLGLERRFDLAPDAIAESHDALAQQARSRRDADLLGRIDAARQALVDPERRASHLLDLIGGPSAEREPGVWAAQQVTIDALGARANQLTSSPDPDPAAEQALEEDIEHERQARLDRIAILLRLLLGHDNPVVQRDRAREARMQLNALAKLKEIARPRQ
jgi:molecular chaperone HscB